jgi:hypothetical protein
LLFFVFLILVRDYFHDLSDATSWERPAGVYRRLARTPQLQGDKSLTRNAANSGLFYENSGNLSLSHLERDQLMKDAGRNGRFEAP